MRLVIIFPSAMIVSKLQRSVTFQGVSQVVLMEMISRVVKNALRELMRNTMRVSNAPGPFPGVEMLYMLVSVLSAPLV